MRYINCLTLAKTSPSRKKSLEKVDQVTAGKATYNTDAPPPAITFRCDEPSFYPKSLLEIYL